MAANQAPASNAANAVAEGPLFTLERANRALVLVRKIAAAIVSRYDDLTELRRERTEYPENATGQERVQELTTRIDDCVAELNELNRELTAVGCVLKDWRTGLVDFPALHRGRRVWLCWQLGEPCISHWHELDVGYAGRLPIDETFG